MQQGYWLQIYVGQTLATLVFTRLQITNYGQIRIRKTGLMAFGGYIAVQSVSHPRLPARRSNLGLHYAGITLLPLAFVRSSLRVPSDSLPLRQSLRMAGAAPSLRSVTSQQRVH